MSRSVACGLERLHAEKAPILLGFVDMLRRKAVASLSTMEQMASAAAKASTFAFLCLHLHGHLHRCLEAAKSVPSTPLFSLLAQAQVAFSCKSHTKSRRRDWRSSVAPTSTRMAGQALGAWGLGPVTRFVTAFIFQSAIITSKRMGVIIASWSAHGRGRREE